MTITGLKLGTPYLVQAETLTAAGPSYTNASVQIGLQKEPVMFAFHLPGQALGWIIFAAVVIGILAVVGFTYCIRLAERN